MLPRKGSGCKRHGSGMLGPVAHPRHAVQVKKALGWEPKVPLREGLARMVDDFTKRCGAQALKPPGRASAPHTMTCLLRPLCCSRSTRAVPEAL